MYTHRNDDNEPLLCQSNAKSNRITYKRKKNSIVAFATITKNNIHWYGPRTNTHTLRQRENYGSWKWCRAQASGRFPFENPQKKRELKGMPIRISWMSNKL